MINDDATTTAPIILCPVCGMPVSIYAVSSDGSCGRTACVPRPIAKPVETTGLRRGAVLSGA